MRRGTILLSVLVIVVIAALTGATAMYVAQAQAATASLTLRRTQARALVWSGVQAAMTEMAEQRESLLDGEEPELTGEWELFQDGAARGIVRLVAAEGESLSRSEAARLNLNTASGPMLTAIGIESTVADAIVAARGASRLESIESVRGVAGMTPEVLRGPAGGSDDQRAEAPAEIASLLTVWSFDPNIQNGSGPAAGDHRGKLRVNLNMEWSDRLKDAVEERFGEGSGELLKGLMDKGATFKSMSDVVAALESLGIKPPEWPELLDALTTSEDPYIPGRIDINRAPAEVLACIPGIDRPLADQIVERRAGLDNSSRRSIAWPLTEAILTPEQFRQAVDHITTRSMQWRIRVEAGVAAADESGRSSGDATLRDRIVIEAVIDLASERPRVAYLRDVTMLEAATSLYETLLAGGEEALVDEASDDELADAGPPAAADEDQAVGPPGSRAAGPPGTLNPRAATSGNTPPAELSPDPWGSGDLDPMDSELSTMGPSDRERLIAESPEPAPTTGIDRRLGRWTTGKGAAR